MNRILLIAACLTAFVAPSISSAFLGGTVVNLAVNDELNIRKWPASHSQIIDSFDNNGDHVSLLGTCKNIASNISFSIDGPQSANWKYNKMRRANVWCKVMSPSAQLGWVRGKYVWPE